MMVEAVVHPDVMTPLPPPTASQSQSVAAPSRLDDLAHIIRSYTEVTDKLQRSHEALHEEVARLQRELSGANAQLQRSRRLAALGEMAAGIAHEIRNPLAAIQLYAGMLTEDLSAFRSGPVMPDMAPQVETAAKIASAVRGLNGIVCDVLAFSREMKPRLGEVEASLLFDRAVEVNRPAIEAANIVVRRQDRLRRRGRLVARVDAEIFVAALVNLIRNAADAMTGEGSQTAKRVLVLDALREDEQLVFSVRDSGPGIADADIDRIFNPFFTTRSTGTGLGLAIVHRIVDAHGGSIVAFNDGGAVFEVRVPAVPAAARAKPDQTHSLAQRQFEPCLGSPA